VKLNFGCGSIQPDGWVNLDADREFNAQYRSTRELNDESFDVVVAHCALQINTTADLPAVLADIRRVLKPGGVLRVSLPNIERGFQALDAGDIDWFPNREDDLEDRFSNWLTWYSTTRTLLTFGAALNLLRKHFHHAYLSEFGCGNGAELDTREGECYFVEAVK